MNYVTFVGAVIGLALVGGAIAMGVHRVEVLPISAAWGIFINVPALMIVLGGSLAATMVAFQSNALSVVARSIGMVLTRKPPDFTAMKRSIVRISATFHQGSVALEELVKTIKIPFLKDGVQMLADAYSVEEIEDVLGQRIDFRLRKERHDTDIIRTIGRFCPAFGMIGTLIGLINMLSRISFEGDALTHIGADMAVALVTTFYGLLLAYLVFTPIAARLEGRTEEEVYLMQMMTESIRMISERWSPYKVEDYLNSFLPPQDRKRSRSRGQP